MAARTSTDGETATTRPLVKWSCYDVASLRIRLSLKKCFQVYELAQELRFFGLVERPNPGLSHPRANAGATALTASF
jgi:hypothetical protein